MMHHRGWLMNGEEILRKTGMSRFRNRQKNIRLRFGQPSEELAVAALLVAAVYLLCCFLRVEWVPAEQKGRQEPEES